MPNNNITETETPKSGIQPKLESISFYTLNERVEKLIYGNGSPESYLGACNQLQFWSHFPIQWHRCRKLVKKAYEELRKNDNSYFEIYDHLCEFAIEFFVNSNDSDMTIAIFAIDKMKETRCSWEHQRIIFRYWLMLKL